MGGPARQMGGPARQMGRPVRQMGRPIRQIGDRGTVQLGARGGSRTVA